MEKQVIIRLPSTTGRVQSHTIPQVNQAIEAQTQSKVFHLAEMGPQAITQRLQELDQEWDTERVLEVTSSTFVLLGLLLGSGRDKKWLALSAVVGGFLLSHALDGWCPPLPVIRRFGFRTSQEIDKERLALRALRGDLGKTFSPQEAWALVTSAS
ncbi:MAG: hypothetical protein C7B47_01215 [Sulfobacillus thermosulfidooxidans]|uniref:DUF2892 domain-containing protein n=1 Tax=Sulfobacillus thermosulfidooxidans TaxID=28034 RepID=A0A2T2X680_SULTH|nr:MAG: hypothetical protein C7B47_01215 [Sulfobacillus thermosulfidooxidans]